VSRALGFKPILILPRQRGFASKSTLPGNGPAGLSRIVWLGVLTEGTHGQRVP